MSDEEKQIYVIVARVVGLDMPAFITKDFEEACNKLSEWRGYGYNPLFCYSSEDEEE